MGLLLHISDLHLGKNRDEETKRIKDLANAIKNEGLDIQNVIFTGDIIDAREIVVLTLEKLVRERPNDFETIDENNLSKMVDEALTLVEKAGSGIVEMYNEYLKKVAIECVEKAADAINGLLDSIGVERYKFISCCGNHDRLRFLGKHDAFECGANKQVDEATLEAEYLPYIEFCKKVNNSLSYKSQEYICDGIRYIIANSNWRTPENRETNNACINCGKIGEFFSSMEKKKDYKKVATIFLSHKPFDDICENAKYIYGANDIQRTVKGYVNYATIMSLHGDKHSYVANIRNDHSELMCGLPICYNGVHYNLIDFSEDNGVSSVRFMVYNGNDWRIVPMTDCVGEVYTLCKKYIKGFALQLISKKKEIPHGFEELFRVIDESFNNERFCLIKTLFRECTTIYDSKQNKVPFNDDNIFEDILQLINLSSEQRVLAIKGEPGTGKSTFLSVQYIYMLRRFFCGESKYIPFYFDLDGLTKEMPPSLDISDINAIIAWYCDEFDVYLSQVNKISSKYGISPCVIVDGLDSNNMLTYTGHTVEHFFYRSLEEKIKSKDGKYIMGLHSNRDSKAELSFEQVKKFEYVCFLNKVSIVSYKKKEHHTRFIPAYLKLIRESSEDEIDKFYNILRKLRRISVDLDYIHGLDELLRDDIVDADSWDVMKRKLSLTTDRFEKAFRGVVGTVVFKAAYLLFFEGYTYELLREDESMRELTYVDFLKIRDNPEVAKFLIARHYIEQLNVFARNSESIAKESILNCFISRDVSVTIRLLIEELGIQAQVFRNIVNKHSDDLQGYFLSSLLYLLGHNKKYNGLRDINIEKVHLYDENMFWNECIYRSNILAQIVSVDIERQQQARNEFLFRLMTDERFRLFNRTYQLWYYDDIKDDSFKEKRGPKELYKKVGRGVDFNNCFMFLVSKIDYCFEYNKPYPLLEVDLFTLCDLIYSRLQYFDSKSLFYSADYNREENSTSASVLKRIVDIIANYIGKYVNSEQGRNLKSCVLVYFETVHNLFNKAMEEIKRKPGEDIDEPFVSLPIDFAKIINLCEMPRIGWNITKQADVFYKKDMPKYEKDIKNEAQEQGEACLVFETIGQHVLESVYIAEMFLPEQLLEEGYDKNKVISLILMSEVGKIAIGHDYTPDFYQASRVLMPKECKGRNEFLIHGAFDGYANLMNLFDAMQDIERALSHHSDINMRICQEIKLIQMEYKYYSLKEKLKFEENREANFKSEFVDLITSECKEIRRVLITKNASFRNEFEK